MSWDRRWLRPGILTLVLLVTFVLTLPITLTLGVRARLTNALGERFDSEVELNDLRVSIRSPAHHHRVVFGRRQSVRPRRTSRLINVQLEELEVNVSCGRQ